MKSRKKINSEDNQAKIQGEIDEIIKEIDRIADDTEFNEKKLLDGTCGGSEFHLAAQPFFYTM